MYNLLQNILKFLTKLSKFISLISLTGNLVYLHSISKTEIGHNI